VSDQLVLRTAPEDGVVTLTLNRAEKKNALSIALRDQLSDTLDEVAGDDAVKTVVITGAGDVFSAGFDLREFQQPELTEQLWKSSDRFHATVLRFPLPLVAAINGPAIAGGFDLAVMCDVRVAAETARFSHPEIEFGDASTGRCATSSAAAWRGSSASPVASSRRRRRKPSGSWRAWCGPARWPTRPRATRR
jgi:enoyl-CoA hydratase/carnithine racemase